MVDLSFLQILARALAATAVLTVMGFSLAAAARLLGDRGVVYDRKVTLNPLVHVDFFGLLGGIAGRIGWIRPVMIDPAKCRGRRLGPLLAAIASMAAVFVFCRLVLLALPWVATSWPASSAGFVDSTIREIATIGAWTLAINIIPVPPLLGGYLLQAVAPQAHSWLVKRHFWVSIALLVLVILTYRSLPGTIFGDWASLLRVR